MYLLLAALAAGYGRGVHDLWRRRGIGSVIPVWHVAAFAAATLVLAVAMNPAVHEAADRTFATHMAQHMTLLVLAGPLLAAGGVGLPLSIASLFPPADFHIGPYLVPTIFFPGVVLGGLTFLGLYAWLFVEGRRNRPHQAHQLLDRPREHPARLGLGVGTLCFYILLLSAAADDIAARLLRVPVLTVLTVIRVLVLAVPLPAGLLAWWLARSLRGSSTESLGELTRPDVRGGLRRTTGEPLEYRPEPEATAHVEAWLTRTHLWRWRYVEQTRGASPVVLTSNVSEQSKEKAVHAAGIAYPGVAVTCVEQREVPWFMRETKGARRARAMVGAAWVVAVLARRRQRRRDARPDPPTRPHDPRRP